MTERKLASIQRVLDVKEIPGADNIEYIRVLGWSLIAKKGEFQVGDLCVFFEIDSILPETEWSEFLRSKKFHIKTMKLSKFGVISQGLALSLSIIEGDDLSINEDLDVTDYLGVTKYEPYVKETGLNLAGRRVSNFPLNVPKTDEPRIQSNPRLLEMFKPGRVYYSTLKMDGSSFTAGYQVDGTFIVASRNFVVPDDGNFWYELAKKLELAEKLKDYPGYFIQGEMVGPGIQSNRLNRPERELYVFNVYNAPEGRYMTLQEEYVFCKLTGLTHVPLVDVGFVLPDPEQMAKDVEGNYSEFFPEANFPREGLVYRLLTMPDGAFIRPSFKFINPKYLLKVGE